MDAVTAWGVPVLVGAGVGLTAVGAGVPVVLSVAGFGPAGVAAGSVAASIQPAAVAAGSVFAVCQSVGAAGLATSTYVAGTAAGAVLGAGGRLFSNLW